VSIKTAESNADEPGPETMAALVAPGHRRLKVGMLLAVNAALLGIGGTFIARYLLAAPKAAAQTIAPALKETPTLTETTPPKTTPPPVRTIPKQEPAPPMPVVHHTHKHPARLRTVSVPKPKTHPVPQPVSDPTPPPPPTGGGNPPAPPPPSDQPPPAPRPPASAEIEEDNVRFVVQHHLPQVQSCYERALKQDSRLEGVIELQFTLQPDGSATAAKAVANSTGNEGLASCLSHLVESWQFPRPADGPLDFVYPFAFAGGG
jgi:outer membrane biosynthesis protein TonB